MNPTVSAVDAQIVLKCLMCHFFVTDADDVRTGDKRAGSVHSLLIKTIHEKKK